MKKLLLIASLLFAAFGANAAETKDLGHVVVANNTAWPADGYASAQDETEMGFGVKIPVSMVRNYAGCKIIGFRIGWGNPTFPGQVSVFLRENSFNAPDVASQKGTVYSSTSNQNLWYKWNEIKLDTPYEIPADPTDLYMGYYVSFPAGIPTASMSSLGLRPAESCFFSYHDELDENGDRIWFDALKMSSQYNALLMVAIVEIPDGTESIPAAEISALFTPGIQRVGELRTAYTKIFNCGTEDITSVKLRYSINDKSYEFFQQLSGGIPVNEQKVVMLPVASLASGDTRIEITEVNKKPNKHKQELTYEMLAVPANVANQYLHRPVAEYFGSESTHLHPMYFDSLFMVGFKPHAHEVSLICHHANDQFMTGDDEDSALALMLSDYNPNIGLPAVMYDRSVIPADPQGPNSISVLNNVLFPMFAEPPYQITLDRPTFVAVNVKGTLNEAHDELKIKVYGDIAPNILPEGEKLYISVYVVEDDVASTAQDWADEKQQLAYGGVMHHMAVIRQRPTAVFGDELAESGDYSVEYTVDLDPEEWKLGDMRVIALVHRGPRNHRFSRQVLNCNEFAIPVADSSIREIAADGSEVILTVENGTITVNGSTDGVNVFTLAGAAVPNSDLRPGIYVVSSNSIKTKVIVK